MKLVLMIILISSQGSQENETTTRANTMGSERSYTSQDVDIFGINLSGRGYTNSNENLNPELNGYRRVAVTSQVESQQTSENQSSAVQQRVQNPEEMEYQSLMIPRVEEQEALENQSPVRQQRAQNTELQMLPERVENPQAVGSSI